MRKLRNIYINCKEESQQQTITNVQITMKTAATFILKTILNYLKNTFIGIKMYFTNQLKKAKHV